MYCILVKEPLKYITVSFFISLQQEACMFDSAAIKWKLQELTKAQNWFSFQFPLFSKIICIISALQYWPYVVLHHTFHLVVSSKTVNVMNKNKWLWISLVCSRALILCCWHFLKFPGFASSQLCTNWVLLYVNWPLLISFKQGWLML